MGYRGIAFSFVYSRTSSVPIGLVDVSAVFSHAGFLTVGFNFDPNSPRAGAATQGRFDGLPNAEFKKQGQWASDRSLRICLDVAMALANRTLQAAAQFHSLLVDPSRIGPIFRVSFCTRELFGWPDAVGVGEEEREGSRMNFQ